MQIIIFEEGHLHEHYSTSVAKYDITPFPFLLHDNTTRIFFSKPKLTAIKKFELFHDKC